MFETRKHSLKTADGSGLELGIGVAGGPGLGARVRKAVKDELPAAVRGPIQAGIAAWRD